MPGAVWSCIPDSTSSPSRPADLLAAIDLHRIHRFSIWDSLIVRAALNANCTTLHSEDMSPGQRHRVAGDQQSVRGAARKLTSFMANPDGRGRGASARSWRPGRSRHCRRGGWTPEERCLVAGPSGSGKSTLLHLLAGLATPRSGSVRVAGQDLAGLSPARDRFRGRSIGLLLQSFHLLDTLSVFDNVRLARHLAGLPEDRARCREVLEDLGRGGTRGARPLHPLPRPGAAGRARPRGGQPAGRHSCRRAHVEPRRRELRAGRGAHRGRGGQAGRHPGRGDPRLAAARPLRAAAPARSAGGGDGTAVNSLLLGARTMRRRPLPAILTVCCSRSESRPSSWCSSSSARSKTASDAMRAASISWWGPRAAACNSSSPRSFTPTVPTGNIRLPDLRDIARHPMVAGVIPLSLGDAYRGFRIVGTTHGYVATTAPRIAHGRAVGTADGGRARLARGPRRRGSAPGNRSSERTGSEAIRCSCTASIRIGWWACCRETGTVLDRLILVDSASVWNGTRGPRRHRGHRAVSRAGHSPERLRRRAPMRARSKTITTPARHARGAAGGIRSRRYRQAYRRTRRTELPGLPAGDGEITALLVRYRTPLAALTLPRAINSGTALQAASPALETARLFLLIGTGLDVFRAFAAILVAASALSLFIALWHAMHEQRYDLAVMRTLGATRRANPALRPRPGRSARRRRSGNRRGARPRGGVARGRMARTGSARCPSVRWDGRRKKGSSSPAPMLIALARARQFPRCGPIGWTSSTLLAESR